MIAAVWQICVHGAAQAEVAQARHRVLIVADDPADPFTARVVAEVRAVAGLEVIIQRPMVSLDADARAEHAEVAMRKLASGQGLELWMADATSGRPLLRQLIVDENPHGPDQGAIALQAAELLRTAFFPKPTAPTPVPQPAAVTVQPPAVAVTPAARRRGENEIQAGIGVLGGPGGVSPALQAWLSYQRLLASHLGIAFDLSLPVARGSVTTPQGSADVGALLAGAGLLARLDSEGGRMTVAASVGGGLASILITGRPIPELVSASTTVYAGLVYLRGYAAWTPVSWLGLGLSGTLATTTSRVRIGFANHDDVGHWGVPIAAGILFAEARWP